jgi:hypothetical protein
LKSKLIASLALIVLVAGLEIGCTPVEQQGRNAAAALNGAIAAAQAQYQTSCSAPAAQQVNPTVCSLIDQAVSGQNALVTATETYCGFVVGAPPANPAASCVPVKSAQAGLVAAIANANTLVLELQAAVTNKIAGSKGAN